MNLPLPAKYRGLRSRVAAGLLRRGLRWVSERAGASSDAGRQGEDAAYWYLRGLGFTMVARNYLASGGGGEVDLIGWDGGTLVFVEVKARTAGSLRQPEDAVDREKRGRLAIAARDYRRRTRLAAPCRFDVISVYLGEGEPVVEHFRDAFGEAGPSPDA